ncbi:hypothetical protein [Anaeromassilibacillus sp. SJQ-1]
MDGDGFDNADLRWDTWRMWKTGTLCNCVSRWSGSPSDDVDR